MAIDAELLPPGGPERSTSMWSRAITWWIVSAAVLVIGLLVGFAPQLGIEKVPLVVTVVELRDPLTAASVTLGLAGVVVALVFKNFRRVLLPLGLALMLAGVASGVVVLSRGVVDQGALDRTDNQLRVLSWNTNGDLVGPTVVAALAAKEHANVVVLPEIATWIGADKYVAALASDGLRMRAYGPIVSGATQTVVLVSTSLGRYSTNVGHGPDVNRSAKLTPVTAGLPTIVALHAFKPALWETGEWTADVDWVASECGSKDVIAVGDFNATVDGFGSSALGRCEDAASAQCDSSVGTWPTTLPTELGMPIDHVLASPNWSVDSFTVIKSEDRSGARHRPILAVLTHLG